MTVKRLTPNLYTDDVQACVRFWVERMQFEKRMEVPDGGTLAFAALQRQLRQPGQRSRRGKVVSTGHGLSVR
jgi:hypothetical protein